MHTDADRDGADTKTLHRSRRAARRARFARVILLSLCTVAVLATFRPQASAHPQAPLVVREIVRLQGYLGAVPPGLAVQREVTLLALGERHVMKVTDAQVFGTTEAAAPKAEPSEIRLQGDRARLAELAHVGSARVTILGERRPGSSELFLLALDQCPPAPAVAR